MSVQASDCRRNYPVPNNIEKKLAVDVGANIGGFSMAYNNLFDEIIFFEANPDTFKIAKSNTENFKNVTGYNFGVSGKDGEKLKLMNHFNRSNNSVSCSPSITETGMPHWDEVIGEVESISLEGIFKMIDNRRINFLKLDCENSEYEILLNKDLSNIDHISMELHSQMGESRYKELIAYLGKFFTIRGDTTYSTTKNTMLYLDKK
jgi:FkbM family methyltransferase